MLRHSWKAALVVVALACMVNDAHSSSRCRPSSTCRRSVADYLFGGWGPGPFGNGEVSYAGYVPYEKRAECGCKIQ